MSAFVIAVDDPRADDVRVLLARHLAFAHEHTPREDVHALDLSGLLDPAITFCSARRSGDLLGVGALKELGDGAGELKSMHTAAEARGQGVGAAMVAHLVGLARSRGYRCVHLETGAMDAFAPARQLYERSGFRRCGPFADYPDSPNSVFMTLALT
jgi:putative acetyltransferase